MKQVPVFNTPKDLWHLNPLVFLSHFMKDQKDYDIIFPLKVKPINDDTIHEPFKEYY